MRDAIGVEESFVINAAPKSIGACIVGAFRSLS